MLLGLKALHNRGILHRDIKAENIIRVNKYGEWKLCDYGLSRTISEKMGEESVRNFTRVGSPYYMSP